MGGGFRENRYMYMYGCGHIGKRTVFRTGKGQGSHRTAKGQFSFQFQRKAMPKNVQTTEPLYSFHLLAKKCSKSFKLDIKSL